MIVTYETGMGEDRIRAAAKEVLRELGVRQAIYPDWIASRRIIKEAAEQRIAALTDALNLLQALQDTLTLI